MASIKPSAQPTGYGQVSVGIHIDGSQIRCNYFALKDYIAMAYDLKSHQVVGPDWIASERFDISAKLPEGAKRNQVGDMLRALLEDRFQLKFHKDSKEFPVYALIPGKNGSKLKEALPIEDAPGGAVNVSASGGRDGVFVDLGGGASYGFANNKFTAKKMSMPQFTDTLTRFMDRPVVDLTGLKGIYDFGLDLSAEDYNAMHIRSAIAAGVNLPPQALRALDFGTDDSLFAAIDALGLKMERRRSPLSVIVVDHVERSPSGN